MKRTLITYLIYLIGLFSLILIFKNVIVGFLNWSLILPIFSQVSSSYPTDAAVLIFLLVVISCYLIRTWKLSVINAREIILLFAVLILYLMVRIEGIWSFVEFAFWNGIYYADIIVAFISVVVLKMLFVCLKTMGCFALIRNWLRKVGGCSESSEISEIKGFRIDEPSGEDDYLRRQFASTVVELMRNTEANQGAFSVGINGCWGSGKTSFFSLMKKEMQQADCIQIDFRAWMCSSPNEIVVEFFKTLKRELSPLNPRIDNRTDRYIDALIEMDSSNSIRALKQIICEVPSAAKGYDDLSREIRAINRRIYVFIDDLDRMDAKEIMEVLRLVRNTANFPNLFYIMAYDKGYVIRTLEEANYHNSEKYLEKIINVDLSLPGFEPETVVLQLIRLIEELLKEQFGKDEIALATEYLSQYITENVPNTNSVFTFRDMNRYLNSLSVTLEAFFKHVGKEDISLRDILVLELIKYYHRDVYEVLKCNPGKYFELENDRYIIIKTLKEETIPLQLLKDLVSNYAKNSISYCANYYRYFAFRLMSEDIAYLEFRSNMYEEDPSKKIMEWERNNKREAIKLHFRRLFTSEDLDIGAFLNLLVIYGGSVYSDKDHRGNQFERFLNLYNLLQTNRRDIDLYRIPLSYLYYGGSSASDSPQTKHELHKLNKDILLRFFGDTSDESVYTKIALLISISPRSLIEEDMPDLFINLFTKLSDNIGDNDEHNCLIEDLIAYIANSTLNSLHYRLRVLCRDKMEKNPESWLRTLLRRNGGKCIEKTALSFIWGSMDEFEDWLNSLEGFDDYK